MKLSHWPVWVVSLPLLMLLALPLIGLASTQYGLGIATPLHRQAALDAISLSLSTTGISMVLCLLFGTPLAWLISRSARTGPALDIVLDAPVVLPPSVVGIGLLLALTDSTPLGQWLAGQGLFVPFSVGAVILAQTIIASPFYVRAATVAFRASDPDMWRVARGLGYSSTQTFIHTVLPRACPQLLAGLGLAWARALGEFGATLIVAGNLPGITQTAPLAIYDALELDLSLAVHLALFLGGVALAGLVFFRLLAAWIAKRLCPREGHG